jgi:hypothetical protein
MRSYADDKTTEGSAGAKQQQFKTVIALNYNLNPKSIYVGELPRTSFSHAKNRAQVIWLRPIFSNWEEFTETFAEIFVCHLTANELIV